MISHMIAAEIAEENFEIFIRFIIKLFSYRLGIMKLTMEFFYCRIIHMRRKKMLVIEIN